MENLLEMRGLSIDLYKGRRKPSVKLVEGVDLTIRKRQNFGVVGESGCGKSITCSSIMGLLSFPLSVGGGSSIRFQREDGSEVEITKLGGNDLRKLRGKDISMIFQEPMTALDPMYTIEEQICESLRFHTDLSRSDMHEAAIALINTPRLLIADEPTTALDVTIQAQILDLMNELRESYDTSVIMITHDLGVIAETCEEVAVFYAGQVVEQAGVDAIFHETAHPYTTGLLRSVTSLGGAQKELYTIQGTVPTAGRFGPGCRFADRCEHCMPLCRERVPGLTEVSPGHLCRCWLHAGGREEAAV